jgi:GAF domain-containing protein
VLCIARHRPESAPFDEAERDLAQILADHAALAIANARSHVAEREARAAAESAVAALRVAQARFNRLADSGIIGIVVARADRSIVDVNSA